MNASIRALVHGIAVLAVASTGVSAQTAYPEAEITNGILTARMYLPDAERGYYRSTRFDWSGAIYSLQYAEGSTTASGTSASIRQSRIGSSRGTTPRSSPGSRARWPVR